MFTRLIAVTALVGAALFAAEPPELSNPKMLPPSAPLALPQIRAHFADPPADYRSMPLWVWNDELQWPRLKQMLEEYKQQGMGGAFVHPRPGLMTEYLGTDWFRLWKLAIEEGKRLGIEVNIYDENSYPAGFAGGHVPSLAPENAMQYCRIEFGGHGLFTSPEMVAVFAVERGANGDIRSARRVHGAAEAGSATLVSFHLEHQSGRAWTAGFPYVDLTARDAGKLFIETTYERYKREIGSEFGKTVHYGFDDEPNVGGVSPTSLPMSRYYLEEFHKRHGYDLADHLPSLFYDTGNFRQVRFDYYQTLHDLWKENYFRPLYLWCDRNNLRFTGHWLEHEWPYPFSSPDDASMYAYEHMPGIDFLVGDKLRLDGVDPHMLFTVKQMSSVAQQLGRRAFVEAYGVSGWDSTLEHYKRVGDWLLVHGVNFVDQHLSYATVRGARKRDHPQSFSDVAAWWPYYKLHGDHLGRVSYLLSQGEAHNRVVVLEPTTSAFLNARFGTAMPALAAMREHYDTLMQFLADHQVDFDLADEYIIEWFGKPAGGKFKIDRASYDVVVWPEDMTNVRHETVPRLEAYLASGGQVLALGKPADYVDGRPSDAVRALRERFASQWHEVSGLDGLLAGIRKDMPPRVRFERDLPPGIGFRERDLATGEHILFFANTGLNRVTTKATIEGGAIEEWDTVSGKITPVHVERSGGELTFNLDLWPAGSHLYVVKKSGAPGPAEPVRTWSPASETPWKIVQNEPNVIALDYCDLKLQGVESKDINTWRANWNIWFAHGFERPAWDNAVQFEHRVFDRNHFDKDSGFDATFHFDVADAAALKGLELAVEVPELYHIEVNGKPVAFATSVRWLDPHIRRISIEKLAKEGENTVTVTGRPFDVRMELENIYLRGNFSVAPTGKGFRLGAPTKLDFGSWAKQGMPFYASSVLYQTEVTVPAGQNLLSVSLGDWQGSVAEVLVDGKRAAVLGWQPFEAETAVTPGKHTVAVRIVSTPRNFFGPFHNPGTIRMRSGPWSWATFPEHQPAGAAYDVIDYGLMKPPAITTSSRAKL